MPRPRTRLRSSCAAQSVAAFAILCGLSQQPFWNAACPDRSRRVVRPADSGRVLPRPELDAAFPPTLSIKPLSFVGAALVYPDAGRALPARRHASRFWTAIVASRSVAALPPTALHQTSRLVPRLSLFFRSSLTFFWSAAVRFVDSGRALRDRNLTPLCLNSPTP